MTPSPPRCGQPLADRNAAGVVRDEAAGHRVIYPAGEADMQDQRIEVEAGERMDANRPSRERGDRLADQVRLARQGLVPLLRRGSSREERTAARIDASTRLASRLVLRLASEARS